MTDGNPNTGYEIDIQRLKKDGELLLLSCTSSQENFDVLTAKELSDQRWESSRRALTLLLDLASLLSSQESHSKLKKDEALLHEDTKLFLSLIGLVVVGGICPNLIEGNHSKEMSRQLSILNSYFRERRYIFSEIQADKDFSSKRLIFTTWNLLKLMGIVKSNTSLRTCWIGKLLIQKGCGVLYAAVLQIVYGPSNLGTCDTYAISPTDQKAFRGYLKQMTLRLNVFLTLEEMFILLQHTDPSCTKAPKWLLNGAGTILSDIFMREHGLEYVTKFFSNNFYEEETGFDGSQLQNISSVILAAPSSAGSSQSYFELLAPKLLFLLQAVCNSQTKDDRGAAILVAFTINQLALKDPLVAKTMIFDTVMSPFRDFWLWFETPALLQDLDEQLISFTCLGKTLSCLRYLVLEGGVSFDSLHQLVFPYLAPLFELYVSSETWTNAGTNALLVRDILLEYFSHFPDCGSAGNALCAILTSKVAVGPNPLEFKPGDSGFGLFKKAPDFLSSYTLCNSYTLNLDAFVKFVSKLNSRGSISIILFMTSLLCDLNSTSDPMMQAIFMQTLALLIQHCGDKLAEHSPKQFIFLLAKLIEKFGKEYLASPEESSKTILSPLINIFSCVLDANHISLEKQEWGSLHPVVPIINDLYHSKSLEIEDIRRCQSIKLLLAFSLDGVEHGEIACPQKTRATVELTKQIRQAHLLLGDSIVSIRASAFAILEDVASNLLVEESYLSISDELYRILIKTIQEEDSYIYLAAIKALSKLAINSNLLPRLTEIYLDSNSSLDFRLRVGEALLQAINGSVAFAIKECSNMIGVFLFALRSPELKASALSLISSMFEKAPMSALPYTEIFLTEMGNVLRIESDPVILRPAIVLIYSILLGLGSDIANLITLNSLGAIKTDLQIAIHRSYSLDLMAVRHAEEACRILEEIIKESFRPNETPFIGITPVKDSLIVNSQPTYLRTTLQAPSVPKSLIIDISDTSKRTPDLDLATRLSKLDI